MSFETVPLSSLCKIHSGGTPSRQKGEYWGGDVKWAKISDIENAGGLYVSETEERISEEGLVAIRNRIFEPGTLLFAMYGSVGKVAITKERMSTNQAILGLKIKDESKLDLKYLTYYVIFNRKQFESDAKGVTQKNLSAGYVRDFKIPLPPLPVQKQIAALLEKADTLRSQCRQMEQELNQLAQSVFLEMFGDPVMNLKGWRKIKLKELVADLQGGKSITATEDEINAGRNRVLKISAVTWGDYLPSESKPLPNDYEPPKEHYVKTNDLLFSRANTTELVGATSLVFETPNNVVLPDKLWRFVWKDEKSLSQVFMWRLLSQPGVRAQLGKIATGSGGSMKNISKGKLLEFEIIFPDVVKQDLFEEKYVKIRHQVHTINKLKNEYEYNFNSLIQRAFKGELKLGKAA